MENEVVKIIWKHGQYLNLYRLTIINSSPLKKGQKVQVIWARLVRHMAVVNWYPLEVEVQQTFTESDLPPRQARAKKESVSIRSIDYL